jgi:hypothetical protein
MTTLAPDWLLINEITRIVHSAPGGGLHRADLAARLRLPASSKCLRDALIIAYSTKRIDFCRQYVVKTTTERKRL